MLNQYQKKLVISTTAKSFHNITQQINAIAKESNIKIGLCTLFVRHTSASLLIQENADPDVLKDLASFFSQLVPEDANRYRHSAEGLDDMPAHIRSVLTKTSEQIPISNGRLVLGTWQDIYLWEHRQHNYQREIVVHISGI